MALVIGTSVSVPVDIYYRSNNHVTILLFPLFFLMLILLVPLKSGLFSSANSIVKRIVTSCSFSPCSFLSHLFSLTLPTHASTGCQVRIMHPVSTNEWVWNISSYQEGPADPLPLQPSLLFTLLTQLWEGYAAALDLTQAASDSNFRLYL